MARPRELSLGAAAGTASRDCTPAAATPPRFWCLRACGGARKALRLPVWAVVDDFFSVLSCGFGCARSSLFGLHLVTVYAVNSKIMYSVIVFCSVCCPLNKAAGSTFMTYL
jgi:hypothetical protein